MQHPHFPDLRAADDAELGEALGSPVTERETVHEWPLSWVQRVVLQDGRTFVYKAQLPPTVEAQFYDRARSPLLAGHRSLGRIGGCDTLVIDWIAAPLLQDLAADDAALMEHGRAVIAQIGRIKGTLPTYLDLGTPDAWGAVAESTIDKLAKLVEAGTFTSTTPAQVAAVRAWATAPELAARVTAGARIVHADLHDDQIFCLPDGYRVIDWQRPIIGPPAMDLASLLINRGIDPAPHVAAEAVGAFWFHRLHWAVQAQADIFPGAGWPLFDHWSAEAVSHLLDVDAAGLR